MPRQGVASTFAFGYSAGLIEGVAAGLGISVEIVGAAVWKKRAGVPADKGAVRQMAARLWPGAAASFARVKDDGRADAALLGAWGQLAMNRPVSFALALIWAMIGFAAATAGASIVIATACVLGISALAVVLVRVTT